MSSAINEHIEELERLRGKIISSKGGWKVGEGIFNHGFEMMNDLVGKVSYMQVIVLNATGRLPERNVADWIEATHVCLSWPDPRVWCNHMGALAGTVQTSVLAATVAGVLANDSRIYGTGMLCAGMEFILDAMRRHEQGDSAEDIVNEECAKRGGKPSIMGYARPFAKGDERVPAMERTQKQLGLPFGKHQQLAYQIDQVVHDRFGECMNIGGFVTSFLADQGYTPTEVYRLYSMWVHSGVTACYVDTADKPPESFLPLRCEDVVYLGQDKREVP